MTQSPLKILSDDDYVRQRVQPRRSDGDYLHLNDLRQLIEGIAPQIKGRVFDYGSGGAPYGNFFKNCTEFVPADLVPGPKVLRVLRADGMTNEPDESYDFILSTQVLEHVQKPESYMKECWRILKPGGQILLTTHGLAEEHGCPHDYQRWTARGLDLFFGRCGFSVIRSGKLTAQIRGIVQMNNSFTQHWRDPKRGAKHFILAFARKIYFMCMPLLNGFADFFEDQAIVSMDGPEAIYVAVFVHAQKPAQGGEFAMLDNP